MYVIGWRGAARDVTAAIALASNPCTRVLRGQHTQNTGYFIKHGLRELQKSRAIFSQ